MEVEVTGRARKEIILPLFIIIMRITTAEEDGPVPADPLGFFLLLNSLD